MKLAFLLISIVTLLVPAAQAAIIPTQWRIEDGGNDHFYAQVVTPGTSRDWASAKAEAEALQFMGVAGHLVTITSAEEQLFVESNYDGGISWIGLTDDPAFGGSESFGKSNPQIDGWVWVTGEPVTFTNWFAAGEPNNQGGFENFVTMGLGVKAGGWNDVVSSPTRGVLERYIVEFRVVSVPEPESVAYWMIALGLLAARTGYPLCHNPIRLSLQ